jgi:hypothetical protein
LSREKSREWGAVKRKENTLVSKLWCVALVVCLIFPLGQVLFPYVSSVIDPLVFSAIEAVVSATLGLGLYLALFG